MRQVINIFLLSICIYIMYYSLGVTIWLPNLTIILSAADDCVSILVFGGPNYVFPPPNVFGLIIIFIYFFVIVTLLRIFDFVTPAFNPSEVMDYIMN